MTVSTGPAGPARWAAPPLVRNTLINFGGHVIPVIAGILAFPLLIAGLGTSRFGVLTLAWMAVGYFSLFDLGLGRALTKLVAERVGTAEESEIPRLARTALGLMLVFGTLGAIIGVALTPWLTRDVFRLPPELQVESESAFLLLALSLPVVITTAGLRGLLEGAHHFGWVNAIRIPTGIFTFVGPLLVLPFSNSMVPVVAVLVAGRTAAWGAHLACCVRAVPGLFRHTSPWVDLGMLPLLLGFGGWMTVTNMVGPIMVYMDRLFIGALVSVAAVAYYATPYEMITKMWLVPGALLGVLFPAFSAGLRQDPEWVRQAFGRSVELLLLILFPATLLIVLFAREGLTGWLGAEFARESATVAKWLAVGVFINSLALVPFNLIQGGGRPDLTAKLHLLELPPYLLGIWWFTTQYGIAGAAVVWTLRAGLDAILLYLLVVRFVPRGSQVVRQALSGVVVAVVALGLAAFPEAVLVKLAYSSVMLIGTGLLARKALARGGESGASLVWGNRG